MSEKLPVDFEALTKGQAIPREQIERAYNVKARDDPNRYRVLCLRLCGEIETNRPDLLPRIVGDEVHVMHDSEADDVTYRRTEKAVASIVANARRRAVIDRSGFNEQQQRVAETRDRHATALAVFTSKTLAKARREELLAAKAEPAE